MHRDDVESLGRAFHERRTSELPRKVDGSVQLPPATNRIHVPNPQRTVQLGRLGTGGLQRVREYSISSNNTG